MKTNPWLFLTVILFAGILARPAHADQRADTNLPPLLPPPPLAEPSPVTAATPAAATPFEPGLSEVKPAAPEKKAAPAKHAKKKSSKPTAKATLAKKKPAPAKRAEISMPLKPGPASVTARRVNVRGKASTRSEVITSLSNGAPVTVIEEITRENKSPTEPTIWAKIALPSSVHGWVHGMFIDAANKTVSAKKLNVRGGPGENYSVVAQLRKGDAIAQIGEKAGWLEIEAPSNAVAYVAAAYLRQEAPLEPAPTPTEIGQAPTFAAPPSESPGNPPVPSPTPEPQPEPALASSPAMPTPELPMILDPSIKREVEREGVVRRTWSIQAPGDFRLVSPDTGENIVYLHSSSTNLDLSRYKGLHIIATGEEGLDRRWKDTPVLTIRRIQVLE